MSETILSAAELNDLRQKVLRGEEIPHEQYKLVVNSLRTRRAADIALADVKKEKAAAKKAGTTDEQLNNILGL